MDSLIEGPVDKAVHKKRLYKMFGVYILDREGLF
jgi:hypothetical protein